MRLKDIRKSLAVLFTFVLSGPATAQMSIGHFGQINVQSGLSATMNSAVRSAAGQGGSSQGQSVTYSRDPEGTELLERAIVASVKMSDESAASELEKILNENDIVAMFDRDLAPFDLKSNRMEDVITAFMVTGWMLVNEAEIPTPDQVDAVRQKVREGTGQETRALSNNNRQVMAELMIYQTMFMIGARTEAAGDPSKTRALAESTHQTMQQMDIDFRGLSIAADGLVKQ